MSTVFFIFGCLVFLSPIRPTYLLPHPASGQIGGIEFAYNDKLYLISTEEETAWGAHLYCRRYGGYLVQPTSAEVEDVLRWAVPGVPGREFWIGIVGDAGQAALDSLENSAPNAFVDCELPANDAFCQVNVEGPHVDDTFLSSTCFFSMSTCPDTDLVYANGSALGAYDNFGLGGPGNSTVDNCVSDTFNDCDNEDGCAGSTWDISACAVPRSFICEKDACPLTMEAPAIPYGCQDYAPLLVQFLGLQTTCGTAYVRTSLNYCAWTFLELEQIRFGAVEDNCPMINNVTIIAQPQYDSCSAGISFPDFNQTAYTYNLWAQIGPVDYAAGSPIQRQRFINATVHCQYNDTQVAVSDLLVPSASDLSFDMDEGGFHTRAAIFLYPNDSFLEPIPPRTTVDVYVPDDVFVGIQFFMADNPLVTQIVYCIAAPDPLFCGCSVDPSNLYYLINDSCAVAPRTTILKNNVDNEATFKFSTFNWADGDKFFNFIFLHCFVELCDPSAENDCYDDSCSADRVRRDIRERRGTMVKSGRISIVKREIESLCDQDNGDCSHQCEMNDANEVICSCPDPDMHLGEDGRTCEYHVIGESAPDLNSDEMFVIASSGGLLLLASVLILLSIIYGFKIYRKKKNGSSKIIL